MKAVKDRLVKELSKKYGMDSRVVRLIADYPIKFFKNKSADDNDIRPIRLRYFGCFTPKTTYIKEYENELANMGNSESVKDVVEEQEQGL